jgi:UDP-N-acetylmuramoyl-tripeptide--D-alanyl-D-alanine ligase
VDEKEAFEAISNYVPTNNRSQIIEKQTNTIVLDAYNANPSSVEVALSSFAAVDTDKRKVVLLGDMLELGTISEAEHLRIVEMAVQYGFDTLAFCGENFCGHKRENAHFFASKADLADFLKENQFENSMILLKGSRGMRMETLVEFL